MQLELWSACWPCYSMPADTPVEMQGHRIPSFGLRRSGVEMRSGQALHTCNHGDGDCALASAAQRYCCSLSAQLCKGS